ncbi:MAG: hypothetical protein M1833_003214 [Piccolia ochrophora]|nr:MAG: hypothetical protein M1833_003214 [Piccolia ochrophora]
MMLVSVLLLSLLSAIASAQGVDFSALPTCAQSCVGSAVSVPGCSGIDIECICKNEGYIGGLSCCIADACSEEDQQRTITFASNLCKTKNVDVPDTVSCSTGSASGTATATVTSTSTASATATEESAAAAATTGAAAHNMVANGAGLAGALAALLVAV